MEVWESQEALGRFFQERLGVKPTLRPRTHESYRSLVSLHIKPALGSRPLAKLEPAEVQAFLNQKHDSGLSASTVWSGC